ncbi:MULTISPECIES: hypothetical protein [unclassified Rhodococcus (in: high G+C Gram-positive bacteria)]|uniref:Excreted virulence factor EspC (Type VII ESX diderm) n=1 Tax=Rhodococcus navarretei TaxID=3128981 RepID=A0ABU9CYC7_9NOCA|nr:hypothetical protein [Rhodococcus sp. ARC_M5]MCJ0890746.1 hypothetical protein [Rhodococcus sp. ARC_M5]
MSGGVWVDVDRVRGVADALVVSADALGAAAASVADAGFGPAGAGRNYGDLGALYIQAHAGLGRAVGAWKSSVDDISSALTTSMNEYDRQDDAAAFVIESDR